MYQHKCAICDGLILDDSNWTECTGFLTHKICPNEEGPDFDEDWNPEVIIT